jgi:deoxyribonuclease V
MMDIADLHGWDLTPLQARQLQEKWRGRVSLRPLRKKPKIVAGLDCSLDKRRGLIFAAAVVFSFPDLEIVEQVEAVLPLTFPYVPGLLSFREVPVCLEAVKKVRNPVDLWLIDGQGIAHPRRLGLASHLGLFLNTPTIGCAKSRLIGIYDEPGPNKGDFTWLYDKDEKIGAVLRTRDNVKPLFASPGHLCAFADAIELTLACCTKYRLPEPTRIAHQTVAKVKAQADR